jgi:hypothetical protein
MKKRMKKLSAFILLGLSAAVLRGAAGQPAFPSMPAAVSSNATASLKGGFELFSMMGVGPKKTWDDVTNKVYVMTLAHAKWHEAVWAHPQPEPKRKSFSWVDTSSTPRAMKSSFRM